MLEDECEEAVRNLVRSYKVSKIRDLQSELNIDIMDDMNRKFNEFGVYIENLVIMTIVVPSRLREALHDTTCYDVKLQNALKKHCKNLSDIY